MPIYEYQCSQCGETTEVLQSFSDGPLETCSACGGHMEKLMSMNSFQLKGNGWYVTDYAGKSGQTKAEAGKTPTPGKEPGADKKTEAPKEAAPKAKDKAEVKA